MEGESSQNKGKSSRTSNYGSRMKCKSHREPILSRDAPSTTNLSILYYNARSILPKFDELHGNILAQNPSVVCVVESWLSNEIENSEVTIPGYQTFRCDRDRQGGGVIMFVQDSIPAKVVPLCFNNSLKFLALSLTSPINSSKHCFPVILTPLYTSLFL